jgi:hypothetical protein
VDDHEQVAVEFKHDALAHAPNARKPPSLDGGDRRLDTAQHEHVVQPDALQHMAGQQRVQAVDVDGYVREFRHSWPLWCRTPFACTLRG